MQDNKGALVGSRICTWSDGVMKNQRLENYPNTPTLQINTPEI
jgi:hypothetical protein